VARNGLTAELVSVWTAVRPRQSVRLLVFRLSHASTSVWWGDAGGLGFKPDLSCPQFRPMSVMLCSGLFPHRAGLKEFSRNRRKERGKV
jgi:hypothetical protein